jgi:hypothetical protein
MPLNSFSLRHKATGRAHASTQANAFRADQETDFAETPLMTTALALHNRESTPQQNISRRRTHSRRNAVQSHDWRMPILAALSAGRAVEMATANA